MIVGELLAAGCWFVMAFTSSPAMLLGLAFIESLVLFVFVIAVILLFVKS